MKIRVRNKLIDFIRFVGKNIVVLLVVLASMTGVGYLYVGIAYALDSPKMFSYVVDDSRLPFCPFARNLYAKLYWDATLTQPEDVVNQKYNYREILARWYDKSHEYAAEKGNMNAQFFVGKNINVPAYGAVTSSDRDYSSDVRNKIGWLTKAVEQGHIEALDSLGSLYQKGAPSLKPDTTKALMYYSRASEKGDLSAMVRLGTLMIASKDTTGLKYLRTASSIGYTPATIELGKFYYPRATPTNPYSNSTKSLAFFKKATEKDSTGIADYYLGWLYGESRIFKDTPSNSMKSFLKSAQKGYNPAKYMLGYLTIAVENYGALFLSKPPHNYQTPEFDELRKEIYDNTPMPEADYDYAMYCGWTWMIDAAEDRYDRAIDFISNRRDDRILERVLSCRNSPAQYFKKQKSTESSTAPFENDKTVQSGKYTFTKKHGYDIRNGDPGQNVPYGI
ncbi:MAG: sel1 repeat family protein [Clostridium sp.]|nr:sel1 repeat family protein [Clostridium sp.]